MHNYGQQISALALLVQEAAIQMKCGEEGPPAENPSSRRGIQPAPFLPCWSFPV